MDYINIGKIIGIHGLNGELSIRIDPEFSKYITKNSFIFVELKNLSFIPYKIVQIKKENSQNFLILFKNLNEIDLVKFLNGKGIYLPKENLDKKSVALKSNYLSSYYLHDVNHGVIGKINEVKDTAGQMLAFLDYEGKEIIIPMNPELIVDVQEDNKIIIMNLPEGLLSIYLD